MGFFPATLPSPGAVRRAPGPSPGDASALSAPRPSEARSVAPGAREGATVQGRGSAGAPRGHVCAPPPGLQRSPRGEDAAGPGCEVEGAAGVGQGAGWSARSTERRTLVSERCPGVVSRVAPAPGFLGSRSSRSDWVRGLGDSGFTRGRAVGAGADRTLGRSILSAAPGLSLRRDPKTLSWVPPLACWVRRENIRLYRASLWSKFWVKWLGSEWLWSPSPAVSKCRLPCAREPSFS